MALVAALPFGLVTATGSNAGSDTSTPITLTAPAVAGAPALPGTGVKAPTATVSPTIGTLTVTPTQGVEGTPLTVAGTGLPANTSVNLLWSTASATWQVAADPSTVNYMGRAQSSFNVILATVTTDASGAFTYATTAPVDFGGNHTIYAAVNNVELAEGGFQILRTLTVTPKSGPIGTPITITYNGIGASLYEGGASLLWDNHYAGEMMANWTRGTAIVTIRATGPVGNHTIEIGDAITDLYMNIGQSKLAYINYMTVPFKVTKDNGAPTPYVTYPDSVTPTATAITTLVPNSTDPTSKAVGTANPTSGTAGTQVALAVTGLSVTGTASIDWSNVVGNRINCPPGGTCWTPQSLPVMTAPITNGSVITTVTVPSHLGGWHVIQVLSGSTIEAQIPFYVKESIVPYTDATGKVITLGVATANSCKNCTDLQKIANLAQGGYGTPTYKFKQGQEFTISVQGVGWTQLDNTLAVDYDNSYIGYGCGFSSDGSVVFHLFATGAPGTHLIDIYPNLYGWQPSFANAQYTMSPFLSYARDFPGLALGYQVPAFHFAITIVK
ncbi:MAG: hypothetical protein ACHQFZ_00145 [Acidimicrobiales bacterium]